MVAYRVHELTDRCEPHIPDIGGGGHGHRGEIGSLVRPGINFQTVPSQWARRPPSPTAQMSSGVRADMPSITPAGPGTSTSVHDVPSQCSAKNVLPGAVPTAHTSLEAMAAMASNELRKSGRRCTRLQV